MAMKYLPLALDWRTFNNRCPYCNSSHLQILQSWKVTIEYECKTCYKIFVTSPYPKNPDILYPVYEGDSSEEAVFMLPEYKKIKRT